MDIKLIECKLIDVPKAKSEDRVFSKEFAVKLADSVKIDGQLQPVVVRPNPASPGRYILIAGKHRLYAIKTVLKEQFIEAKIIADMDEQEATMASIVENLWRNPLNKAQHALAVKKWHEHWLAKLPPMGAAKADEKVAEISQTDNSGATKAIEGPTDKSKADGAAVAASKAASEGEFDQKVADATGQSLSSVRRAKRIGEAFTPDQLEVFTQMSVSQTDMFTIAKIKDAGQRAEVVNLIASGMEIADAIKEVMKDAAPVRDNGNRASKEETEAKAATAAEKAPDLTDDEWFDKYCGEKAAMLKNPAKFKADALLFRSITDTRHAFRCKTKKTLAAIKKTAVYGALWNLVNRFVSVSHPKDWLICGECKGAGETAKPDVSVEDLAKFGPGYGVQKCPKCFGGGYLLKTEEYL